MKDKQTQQTQCRSITTSGENYTRWFLAIFITLSIAIIFSLFFRTTEPKINQVEAPYLHLDYVVLQKKIEKKKPKPPKKRKPKPPKKEIEKPIEPPKAEAPIKETEPTPAPADIMAVEKPIKKKTKQPPVRIQSVSELDNTRFFPVYNLKPLYPRAALRNNIEGWVDLDLIIDEKGRVKKFSIVKVFGHPAFGNATAKTVPKWRFPPPRINGKKVIVKYIYRIKFELN